MANGRELFSELFGYVLLFEQTNQQGEFQPSYEQVRRDIAALLEQEKAAAKRQGLLERDYQDACFAVVAWADETILKHSSWEHHHDWNALPLQMEQFQTRNAGEEFFERLERLRPEQKQVREVYYLCLGLGFSGQYFLGMEDELKLHHIRHEQAQHLALPAEDVQNIDKLTPQPYQVPTDDHGAIERPWTDLLLRAGLPLLILMPIVLALTYWFWLAPPSLPVVPLADRVKQWLGNHPEVLACANVTIVGVQAGVVSLSGRVAYEAQAAEIRKGVQSLERGVQVKDAFQTIPAPFCEVLDLLEPFKQRNEEQTFGLTASLNKQGDLPLYFNHENFIVEVKTPIKFASYVYVDYYGTDETVGHLFPNEKETSNHFGPNRTYTVGQLNGPHPWLILPPFGRDLVTVIASKAPLFLQPRAAAEPARTYLKDLRQALPNDVSRSETSATFYFIKTQERP
ncbi:MAG TPA: DotU/TssL family secretion system protein [Candidatus Tectomicrobia bacterium]